MYNLFAASGIMAVGFFMGLFGKLELAQDGRTDYVIVKSANPTAAEQFAVEDLGAYLQKVTGARFAVVSETNAVLPVRAIYVGWTEYARNKGIDGSTMGDEEWVIKSIGKNLVLTGGRPRGTLYAVYEFLEQQVSCHWLDEITEIIPSQPSLAMKKLDIRGQPAFWDRRIGTSIETCMGAGGAYSNIAHFRVCNKDTAPSLDEKACSRQGVGSAPDLGYRSAYGSPGFCHTFREYSKEWPTNHPEYLALNAAGIRVASTNGGDPGQICPTHPEVRKLMLQQLKGFIAKDRAAAAEAGRKPPRIYAVEPNDIHWMCQCPECKAFCKREGSASGPYIDLLNALADGIKAEYPDVLVETFAYTITLKPPKTVRPRANVMIRLAQLNAEWEPKNEEFPDMFRPMTNAVNRQPYATLLGWSKIAKHMAYWDYWIQYSPNDKFPTPYVNVRCLQPDLKLFHDNSIEMMYVECENHETTSFFALKRWVGSKLMQNPDQDPAPLVKTFMKGFYGPAAGKMTEYLDYMEDRIAAVPETNNLSAMKNYERPYLDFEFYKTCQRLLDEAEAACGTDKTALLNVQRERIPVDGGLYCMWELLNKKLPAGQAMPWDQEEIIKRYEVARLAQLEVRAKKSMMPWLKDALSKEVQSLRKEEQKIRKTFLIEARRAERRAAEKPPVLRIPRLADETAAGDPAKVDWPKAAPISQWRTLEGDEMPARKLKGALAQDGKYLYVALEETLGPVKLSSKDAWELFFAAQRGKTPYRQTAINPDGKHIDYEWANLPADGNPVPWANNAVIKSGTTGECWQLRAALPLADLIPGGVKIGQPFFMHVFRNAPAPGELMCWSPTFEDGFHDLMRRAAELTLE